MAPLRQLLVSSAAFTAAAALPQSSLYHRASNGSNSSITVSSTPENGGGVLPESFVAYSIEFAFFPEFAGNKSNPNTFSNNLLDNLKELQGTKPYIRVGGNTQDYALYNASLTTAKNGTIIPSISTDYPRLLTIGPSFFESYSTWPSTKFIHGFNLAINTTENNQSLLSTVPLACSALNHSNFLYWEMGNEPDLYKTSAQGAMRPKSWDESDYVEEWRGKTGLVQQSLVKECGSEWASEGMFKWIAPSFAGTNNSLNATKTWQAGLGNDKDIAMFSSHNYIGGATQPGVTLAGFLLNHTKTVLSVQSHIAELRSLQSVAMDVPYILGETNSLYNQGAPGLSNSFGAALWGLNFNLYCAATGIKRVHMHMGLDYRYASWQPVGTGKTTVGTKPPYYGNVAVAAALGDLTSNTTEVVNIPLQKETEAAYAIYNGSTLKRLAVVNMQQYNYTTPNNGSTRRGSETYRFSLPRSCKGTAVAQRLIANGSDAITGITFGGYSYNYELDNGKPQLLGNVTKEESVSVGSDGAVSVEVPWSSAVTLGVQC